MSANTKQGALYGLLIEFESPSLLMAAVEKVRDEGFKKWDVHTPFPVHGMDDAMGIRGTNLPFLVLGGGLTGLGLATLMQWWMNAVDYKFVISGKPLFGLPANIPVMFELTVLFSAFAAFFGMWILNGLPKLYHPPWSKPPIPGSSWRKRGTSWPHWVEVRLKKSTKARRTDRCHASFSTSCWSWSH